MPTEEGLEKQSDDLESHPHTLQSIHDVPSLQNILFKRDLLDTDPQRHYFTRTQEQKSSVVHWGQRKLFMNELSFLTECYTDDIKHVLYAGAAPGIHIPYLVELFPQLHFTLVDPKPFDQKLVHDTTGRISVINDYFTDELAHAWSRRDDMLFISDIRSANYSRDGSHTCDMKIVRDMKAQERWVNIMNPRAATLKFRPLWNDLHTRYFDGTIKLQVWGPVSSTETRMIVRRDTGYKHHNNRKYERQMFHFNSITRVARYPRQPDIDYQGNEFDACYDCTAELHEWNLYRKRFQVSTPIRELANRLTKELGGRVECIIQSRKRINYVPLLGKRKREDENDIHS